ncbi:type II CAAX prenyl endopeptidase Rce1 family protein [Kitasatospora sp. NPDC058444]|uniref:CPBP family glutamic-type intramembrane protease n=1 Tax=Kitasatospora sp. NPDC058444 TaxID=3346504 RepID=UPI00366262BD
MITAPDQTLARPATLRWLLLWGTLAVTTYAAQGADLAVRLSGGRLPAAQFAAIECAGVLGASAAVVWLRRSCTTQAWRDPVALSAAVLGLCRLTIAIGDGSRSSDLLRLLLIPAVAGLLAVELMRQAGVPVRLTRPTRRAITSAVPAGLGYLLALYAASVLSGVLAQYYSSPSQTTETGVHRMPTAVLITMLVAMPAVEELVLTGTLVGLGRQLHVPLPLLLAAAAAGRIALHAYLGVPGLAGIVLAVVSVGLYWQQRRLVPLVAAHVAWDFYALHPLLLTAA